MSKRLPIPCWTLPQWDGTGRTTLARVDRNTKTLAAVLSSVSKTMVQSAMVYVNKFLHVFFPERSRDARGLIKQMSLIASDKTIGSSDPYLYFKIHTNVFFLQVTDDTAAIVATLALAVSSMSLVKVAMLIRSRQPATSFTSLLALILLLKRLLSLPTLV